MGAVAKRMNRRNDPPEFNINVNLKKLELTSTYSELLNAYMKGRVRGNKSESTMRDNEACARLFLRFLQIQDLHPKDCEFEDFEVFFDYLTTTRKCKPVTNYKYHNMLSTFYRILGKENPEFKKVFWEYRAYVKEDDRYKNFEENSYESISEDEYELIADKLIESTHSTAERDALAIDVLWETGCRRTEVANLKCNDLRKNEKKIKIRKSKNYKQREVPISDELIGALLNHIAKNELQGPETYVFQSTADPKKPLLGRTLTDLFKEIVDELKKDYLIENQRVVVHSLRHTRIRLLIRNGMKLEEVQYIAGHKSVVTTMIYFEMEKYAREVCEKMRNQLNK